MVPGLTTKADNAIVRIFIGFKVRRPPRTAPLPAHVGTWETRTSSKKADHTRSSDLIRSLFSHTHRLMPVNGRICGRMASYATAFFDAGKPARLYFGTIPAGDMRAGINA
jgi:hypothetical protein